MALVNSFIYDGAGEHSECTQTRATANVLDKDNGVDHGVSKVDRRIGPRESGIDQERSPAAEKADSPTLSANISQLSALVWPDYGSR